MSSGRLKPMLVILGLLLLILTWRYVAPSLGLGGGEDEGAANASAPRTGLDEESSGGVPAARRTSRSTEHQGARPGDRVAVLRVADLERIPPAVTAGRDPWRFVDPPPPPPPPPPAPPRPPSAEELQRLEEARRAAAERARLAALEAAKPRPAEFTLEYLGYFGPPDRKIAVFTDGRNEITVLEGGTIDNKFIVAHIGYESVDIRFVGFPDWPAKRLGVRSR